MPQDAADGRFADPTASGNTRAKQYFNGTVWTASALPRLLTMTTPEQRREWLISDVVSTFGRATGSLGVRGCPACAV
jgi:hypothetical protein